MQTTHEKKISELTDLILDLGIALKDLQEKVDQLEIEVRKLRGEPPTAITV